jgi:cytochrome c-type biogenesis protein CcmH
MRTGARLASVGLALGLLLSPALAVQPDEILADSALESRARALSRELRCMVCQNESIDDSNAPLARDLRLLVRERLTAGDSDAAVRDFLVARYGDFVLLRPRFSGATILLWSAPFALLLAGAAGIGLAMRRRRLAEEPALTPDEERRIAELIAAEAPAARRDGHITNP